MSASIGVDFARMDGNKADWPKARASGLDFALLRAIYGLTPDPTWRTESARARAAGVQVGAYGFPLPGLDVKAWVKAVTAVLGEAADDDLPFFFDIEFPHKIAATGKTRRELVLWVLEVARRLREALRYWPGIYTSVRVLDGEDLDALNADESGIDLHDLTECPDWAPRYATAERTEAIGDDPDEQKRFESFPAAKIAPSLGSKPWITQVQGDAKRFKGFSSTVDVDRFEAMSPGEIGPRVSWLQRRLGMAEATQGTFDGVTLDATKAFQVARGLAADGVVGLKTFARVARST